ncbi:clathrin light chain isoform X1 [Anthonomus grandis grandis]|uniref:clathrin light chain isoform X1 n=1 Tax=Anthonomus grandis grandis TaxID=2921223 RepID=UPI002165B9E8|nr:clathrin light chain isoform X1 [Anthonomus grandis grandis]
MSGFGDNFDHGDVDPAADFLAREQDELAGLEDEVKPAAVVSTLGNGDDPAHSAGSFEIIDNFDQEGEIKNDLFSDGNGFDIKSEPIDDDIFGVEPRSIPDIYSGSAAPSGISPPISLSQPREEPEKIKKWREEQVKRLEEKDREEEKKKEELRQIAKKELEDWYKNHEEAIAKTKAANRNAEKQFVAEDDEIQPGTEWERIAKLCDFNPKAKPGSKDVSRMRSIILQMKQNPVQIKNKA